MTGPIFIGGASRSGKTLMRAILSSHSRIAISRRTEMWPRFHGRFGDLAQPENLERCLHAMLERRQIAALGTDVGRLQREFASGPRTYPRLFALVHEQYAERRGRPRWGDHSPGLERMASLIIPAYEGTRFVHMVRDPRDRYVALLETRPPRRLGLQRSTLTWVRSAVQALHNTKRYPGSYRAVRYEALVTRPEETMRDLCTFLGEEFEFAMIRMETERRYDADRTSCRSGIPLSNAYVGRYREVLDRRSCAFVRTVAHPEMRAFGYARVAASGRDPRR